MGAPIASRKVSQWENKFKMCEQHLPSHIESNKQMVEKDFSPPDKPFVSRPLAREMFPSGSTCHSALAWSPKIDIRIRRSRTIRSSFLSL